MTQPTAPQIEHSLPWGNRYLMVEPTAFRVDYAINPFMHLEEQPDPQRTRAEWDAIVAAIRDAGGEVEVLPQRDDSPDMVYAMNLGLAVAEEDRPGMVLSHMRYPQRRNETLTTEEWASARGYRLTRTGRDGVGAHLEAGDAFPWRGELLVGFGPRTEELALKHLATELGVAVRGFRIRHASMYHMDLSFLPLDERRAMVCPAAYDEESAEALLALVPEPLVLTEEEALTFCANSIVVGRTVIMPACPDPSASSGQRRVRAQLEAWDFEVVIVEVGEFLKGGGAIRCLTNPLDIRLGRDLARVPGGRVTLP